MNKIRRKKKIQKYYRGTYIIHKRLSTRRKIQNIEQCEFQKNRSQTIKMYIIIIYIILYYININYNT